MATAQRTTDHEEIRRWVESRGGHPAIVEGTGGMLRIDFGEPEEHLEHVDWDRFFDIFDRSNIAFLYDPKGHMVKFVEGGMAAASNGRRKSSSRKKSTSSRKKSTSARKKTTGSRKKSTGRKYGKKAGRKVERAMHEMKRGELKSGRSGKKVKSRKQAIAIGLSEARRSGGKAPPNPNRRKSSRRKRA